LKDKTQQRLHELALVSLFLQNDESGSIFSWSGVLTPSDEASGDRAARDECVPRQFASVILSRHHS
jgi:hypothetical protein